MHKQAWIRKTTKLARTIVNYLLYPKKSEIMTIILKHEKQNTWRRNIACIKCKTCLGHILDFCRVWQSKQRFINFPCIGKLFPFFCILLYCFSIILFLWIMWLFFILVCLQKQFQIFIDFHFQDMKHESYEQLI